ncbi:xanthine dehydrogenase family protein molybdopterin-binding subunit [Adhaeribacter pallidiroseus]|uniref:Isoquinoline 1-oxidoreductase n=1 Tax=Adhaeribacter pallidiroseus TaxID=2072847 RepID=A0A369QDG9_9BACT|nr:molybdopterin cofactor-binding domain-containing protein [Adhaeribacter pallidiroseus]RDC62462.1 Isoquinoline 1-oxidoreductase [Adhaeribacter pallidiroseus]
MEPREAEDRLYPAELPELLPAAPEVINRRKFIKWLGGGLAVALVMPPAALAASPKETAFTNAKLPESQIGAWLHISPDSMVSVFTGKVEVGQNIRTSLAQVVAEELRVPITAINMIMGDTDQVPYDAGTFGSRSTPAMGSQLRKAAVSARETLLTLAAQEWKVDKSTLQAANGKITHPASRQKISYGDVVKGKQLVQEIIPDLPATPVPEWKIAGTSVPKVNGRRFITGKHTYVSDMKLPGMLYGKILRPPSFGATLITVDVSKAQAINGVTVVHEKDFVGVAAPDLTAANKALAAIKAEWQTKPQPARAEIFDFLKKNASNAPEGGRNAGTSKGNITQGLSSADKTLKATYTVEYIAHAPMEPRAALAQWKKGKLTVWTGTQRPFGVQSDLAEEFNLPKEQVRVIMPDTGSAYGGKHSGEAASEAARLAKAAQKPVKLTWTRPEEFTWAYFRPAGVIEVSSGIKNDGTLTAWEFHNYNSGNSGIHTPYTVENQQIQFHPVESPLQQGSYRGLASTANIFALESQMNDLAQLANLDPLAFRLKNLKEPRLQAVLEAAAEAFGWGKAKPAPDHGFGLAGGTEKGGFTASCAEVVVDRTTGAVKVLRLVTAFECGAIINPAHLDQQIMGAMVQGLGGALFEAIDFENGKILNPTFAQYRVPRFKDVPAIQIVQINRPDLPSAGAGEAPIVGIAPAIRNAIADATGIKLKTLPLAPNGLSAHLKKS